MSANAVDAAGEVAPLSVPVFGDLKAAVSHQFKRMSSHDLFRTEISGDDLWTAYLASFPAGSNPIFRKRTEHDCGCCRQFIRAIGNVVAIIDGRLVSLWDAAGIAHSAYQVVTETMSALVKSHPIANRFLHYEAKVGTDRNFENAAEGVLTWNHFYAELPQRNERKLVCRKAEIGPILSETRAQHDVLLRSLTELTVEAAETVLDLTDRNSLYRGEEHRHAVKAFLDAKVAFDKLPASYQDVFAWQKTGDLPGSVSKIRNTSIGSLLTDLSAGRDLEDSVRAYERMVAPANYKRPTTLVTQAMVERARAEVESLGLTSALERRFATLADVSVNNVLFADRSARVQMKDAFSGIAKVEKPKGTDHAPEVPIETFLADILPGATSLEIMVENSHAGNFVSLIAPADTMAKSMFLWENRFSWSYAGDLADSDIRRAVQARGGRVDGVFRFSHSWNHEKRNASLMDLHVFMPGNHTEAVNGVHDFYGNGERVGWNHRRHIKSGGTQDVDYTQPAPPGYIPVENITFPLLERMPTGRYVCKIHNWALRPPTHGGFRAEIEFGGRLFQYDYDKPMGNKEWVTVAEVTLENGMFTIKHHLPEAASSRKIWGIDTHAFQRVNVVMLSPNHWDGRGVGNRHYFFMLDQCRNDGSARGFYNEFLGPDLAKHRKVFEILGAKMRAEESPDQLSGIGFSSTQRNAVIARVSGSRVVRVTF